MWVNFEIVPTPYSFEFIPRERPRDCRRKSIGGKTRTKRSATLNVPTQAKLTNSKDTVRQFLSHHHDKITGNITLFAYITGVSDNTVYAYDAANISSLSKTVQRKINQYKASIQSKHLYHPESKLMLILRKAEKRLLPDIQNCGPIWKFACIWLGEKKTHISISSHGNYCSRVNQVQK